MSDLPNRLGADWKSVLTLAVLAVVLLSSCDSDQYTGYLEEEIPPCTPVEGSSVDPCEPGVSWMSVHGSVVFGDEPLGIAFSLGDNGTTVSIAHLVLRGTYLPGTVRCNINDRLFRPPPHSESLAFIDMERSIKCYANVRVNDYILGSGPSTLAVLVWRKNYWFATEREVVEELRSSFEQVLIEGGELNLSMSIPTGGIEGREAMLFLGPSVDTSAEVWEVFDTWDVEQQEDGTVIAAHPFRDYWSRNDYEAYRSRIEMKLSDFTEAVEEANEQRINEYGGHIVPEDMEGIAVGVELPMLVDDANELQDYYIEIGAYDHPDGPPVQPPPP